MFFFFFGVIPAISHIFSIHPAVEDGVAGENEAKERFVIVFVGISGVAWSDLGHPPISIVCSSGGFIETANHFSHVGVVYL